MYYKRNYFSIAGLDRLLTIICGAQSVRDVIAFPKSGDGKDLMSKAPAPLPKQDLEYYHLEDVAEKKVSTPQSEKAQSAVWE